MARTCQVAREEKREQLVRRYRERREALKKAQIDPKLSEEERLTARLKLNQMPRDASASRLTRRCQLTGRARGVYRKFKLSRIAFRQLASGGMLPGVVKSSW